MDIGGAVGNLSDFVQRGLISGTWLLVLVDPEWRESVEKIEYGEIRRR